MCEDDKLKVTLKEIKNGKIYITLENKHNKEIEVFGDIFEILCEQKEIIDKFVFPIRKAAHFSEYLILGILIISFISEFKALEIKYLILAIFISMLYAISDEIHQLFVSGRSARVFDIVIDTLGATTGISIYNFIKNKIRIITE